VPAALGIEGAHGARPVVADAATDHLPPAPPPERIAIAIRRALDDGGDRIRIRLWPAELGHVEVMLRLDHDQRVGVSVAVERPETLELLQRDARGLERALADAGVKLDSGSLSFNLRHGDQGGTFAERDDGAAHAFDDVDASSVSAVTDATTAPVHVDRLRLVDLRA
jgi:hypothetical protein